MKKAINCLFLILVFLLMTTPGILTYFNQQTISKNENRVLAEKPLVFNQDGTFNLRFSSEYEKWLGDSVGFRDEFVACYALTQYYIFHNLASEGMYFGANDDLNYADDGMLLDYAHLNLYTENELNELATDYQYVSDWLQSQGIQFYYMQCYDKHSIYPEQYMKYVFQYGDISKADQLDQILKERTMVNVVPVKEKLLEEKKNREVYSNWGDPTHWNEWGALVGYRTLMETINEKNSNQYRILNEAEYICFEIDYGKTLNGVVHRQDMIEAFDLKESHALEKEDKGEIGRFAEDNRHRVFENRDVKNNTRILILGDSYLDSYILDDIAESFERTAMVWSDNMNCLDELIETYQPDIVIFENVERRDRGNCVVELANHLRDSGCK